MDIQGTIIVIGDTQIIGSAGTFKKRLIVIETDEEYKQTIPADFIQDKCDILDNYQIGEKVKISINIRGNEYQGKYYVNLQGWRIERTQQQSVHDSTHPTNKPPTTQAKPSEFEPTTTLSEEELDDLPF